MRNGIPRRPEKRTRMLGRLLLSPNRQWTEMRDNVKRWHRWGGPAIENSSGAKEWYRRGYQRKFCLVS